MIDFDKYLVHSAVVYNRTDQQSGAYSNKTNVATVGVPTTCYAYFGTQDAMIDMVLTARNLAASPSKWYVILPLTWLDTLKVGALINSIVDESGITIREAGYVDTIDVYRHYEYGPQIVIAKLNN